MSSSIIQFLPILTVFFLLNHLIHTYAGNFLSLRSPIDKIDNYEHLVSQDSTHSAPKLGRLALGRVNTIATAVTIAITLLNIIVYKLREIHEANLREKYESSEQLCRRFLLVDILSATKNFDDSLVVGQGGFGKVYRGVIDGGTITVAIKRLNPMSKQGAPEFWAEIEMLSRIRHSNIVSLIGYCNDCDEMILIYDYMVNGTLADNIHINGKNSALPWAQRVKICIGAARGLDYLHTGTGDRNRIIHRDVKSSNILLSENWTAKISDFGMSKIGPTNQLHTHVSTNVKGTIGYVDPEYFLTHQLTRKSDVYAFGVVLFEVLCGRRAVDLSLDVEQRGLGGWAQQCIKEGKLEQIIDPSLGGQILSDSLTVFAEIADQCLHMFSTKRPTMAEVVVALELALTKQERTDFSIYEEEFFINTGGDCDNQENAESSIKEEVIIYGDFNNQENADSSVKEQVVSNSNNDLCQDDQLEGIMQLDDVSNNESGVKPARGTGFTKTVWKFFFGTGRVASGSQQTRHNKAKRSGIIPCGKRMDFGYHKDFDKNYTIGKLLGHGKFGNTYVATDKKNGDRVAVKKIDKNKMVLPIAVEDVKREVKILEALSGHENVVQFYNAFEDDTYIYIVMELCEGGELLDRILSKKNSRYTEKDAVRVVRQMLKVAAECHLHGLVHRSMRPEKFLFKSPKEDLPLKATGFGRSDFIRPGKRFTDIVGSAYYVAPEVLKHNSGPESDVWSIGVITYILLCGRRPFWDKTNDGIFKEILRNKPDFRRKPWPSISNSAKDFVKKLLVKDPRARLTAAQALSHPWVREGGDASEIPLDISVLFNMRQFVKYSRLKQFALRALASALDEEELSDLKDQFHAIDADKNGAISLEEMRQAFAKDAPWQLKESRVLEILEAIDSNTDGLVDFDEFVAATLHVHQLEEHNSEKWQQVSQAAFEKFDVNRDGYITPEELKMHTGLRGSIDPLLEEADIDKDGKISLSEFRRLLRTGS